MCPTKPEPPGGVRPTPPGLLAGWFIVALIGGWSVRLIWVTAGWNEPRVAWVSVGLIWFLAVVMGMVARATRQSVRKAPTNLVAHQAVNRLAFGKAGAVVGALVAGGYFGYALAQLGVTTAELADQRLLRSAVAGVGGIALLGASKLLERACRVPADPEDPTSL